MRYASEGEPTCGKPSRGRYKQGCRCLLCRAANANYEYERSHGLTAKRNLVGEAETARARKRVERWRAQGIGLRTVELWTGVHRSALQTLLLGNHPNCNGRTKHLSRENYDAIMGCRDVRIAPNTPVDSAQARKAVDGLLAAGWTKARIARESGIPYQTLVAMCSDRRGTGKCAAKTRDAILALASGRKIRRAQLEEWQWQEARHDYQHGIGTTDLAERYGLSESTIRSHMRANGVVFASAV